MVKVDNFLLIIACHVFAISIAFSVAPPVGCIYMCVLCSNVVGIKTPANSLKAAIAMGLGHYEKALRLIYTSDFRGLFRIRLVRFGEHS
jgi:hypothetical protein